MAYWKELGGTVTEENWPIVLWTSVNQSVTNPTSYQTLTTYNMPADTMSANDSLYIWSQWESDYAVADELDGISYRIDVSDSILYEYAYDIPASPSGLTSARPSWLYAESTTALRGGLGAPDPHGLGTYNGEQAVYITDLDTTTDTIPITFKGVFGTSSPGSYIKVDTYIVLYRAIAGT